MRRIVLKCAQNVSPFAVTPLESALTKKQGGGGYLSLNKITLQIFPNLELHRRVKRSTQGFGSSSLTSVPGAFPASRATTGLPCYTLRTSYSADQISLSEDFIDAFHI
jgi:hypothetical protein